MTDRVMALLAFLFLLGFLGILVWFVPRLDLGAVVAVTLAPRGLRLLHDAAEQAGQLSRTGPRDAARPSPRTRSRRAVFMDAARRLRRRGHHPERGHVGRHPRPAADPGRIRHRPGRRGAVLHRDDAGLRRRELPARAVRGPVRHRRGDGRRGAGARSGLRAGGGRAEHPAPRVRPGADRRRDGGRVRPADRRRLALVPAAARHRGGGGGLRQLRRRRDLAAGPARDHRRGRLARGLSGRRRRP